MQSAKLLITHSHSLGDNGIRWRGTRCPTIFTTSLQFKVSNQFENLTPVWKCVEAPSSIEELCTTWVITVNYFAKMLNSIPGGSVCIVIYRQSLSFYLNSSVCQKSLDAPIWDRNPPLYACVCVVVGMSVCVNVCVCVCVCVCERERERDRQADRGCVSFFLYVFVS